MTDYELDTMTSPGPQASIVWKGTNYQAQLVMACHVDVDAGVIDHETITFDLSVDRPDDDGDSRLACTNLPVSAIPTLVAELVRCYRAASAQPDRGAKLLVARANAAGDSSVSECLCSIDDPAILGLIGLMHDGDTATVTVEAGTHG